MRQSTIALLVASGVIVVAAGALVLEAASGPDFIEPEIICAMHDVDGLDGLDVEPTVCAERCTPPLDLDSLGLSAADSSYLMRRTILCADLECGRIDRAAYNHAIAELRVPEPERSSRWADDVVSVSSEYAEHDWSAAQTLGEPDVYPNAGDEVHAWAPEDEDGGIETIEVSFAAPAPASAVEIFETYNAGAVIRVELIGASGESAIAFNGAPSAIDGAHHRVIETRCTNFPVERVRLTLDTAAVPGWNEIDAIGLRACGQ